MSKKINLVILILLLINNLTFSQVLQLFDIDHSNYPTMSGKLKIIDKEGNFVLNPQNSDIKIFEDQCEKTNFTLSPPTKILAPVPLSIILTIDISTTMRGEHLDTLKYYLNQFIDQLPLYTSECAITSFDHEAFVNQDFTHNPNLLKIAIDSLKQRGGTNFDKAFNDNNFGAFKVAQNARNKKIIIFITDGFGSTHENDLIAEALKNNIIVYCISLDMIVPQTLKNISLATEGKYYDIKKDYNLISNNLSFILQRESDLNYITLTWQSDYGCSTTKNLNLLYKNQSFKVDYEVDENQTKRLMSDLNQINFGNIEIGKSVEKTISFNAYNSDFEINTINNSNQYYFELDSFNLPLKVKKNQSFDLKIKYQAKDSAFAFTNIIITNNLCEDNFIYADGGYLGIISTKNPSNGLKVIFPNGYENLASGIDTTIKWSGVRKDEIVRISYSNDNGNSWYKLIDTSGLSFKLKMPYEVGNQFKLKVTQLYNNNLINVIETNNDSIIDFGFTPKDTYIFILYASNKLEIFDAITAKKMYELNNIEKCIFSEDESFLITACTDFAIKIYDGKNFKIIKTLKGEDFKIKILEYNNLKKLILATFTNQVSILWDLTSEKILKQTNNSLSANFDYSKQNIIYTTQEEAMISTISLSISENALTSPQMVFKSVNELKNYFRTNAQNCELSISNDNVFLVDPIKDIRELLNISNSKVKSSELTINETYLWKNADSTVLYIMDNVGNFFVKYLNYTYLQLYSIDKLEKVIESSENIKIKTGIKNIIPICDQLRYFIISDDGNSWIWYADPKNRNGSLEYISQIIYSKKINNFVFNSKSCKNMILSDYTNNSTKFDAYDLSNFVKNNKALALNAKFSNDGNKIYSIENKSIKVTDASAKTFFFKIDDNKDQFADFKFNSDGSKIVSCSDSKKIKIWKSSQEIISLQIPEDIATNYKCDFTYSNDKIKIINNKGIIIYDSYTGRSFYSLEIPKKVLNIDYNEFTNKILIANNSQIIVKDIYNTADIDTLINTKPKDGKLLSAYFLKDSTLIISAYTNKIIIWDYKSKNIVNQYNFNAAISQLTLSKSLNYAFIKTKPGAISLSKDTKNYLYEINDWKKIIASNNDSKNSKIFYLNKDESTMAQIVKNNVCVWNLEKNKKKVLEFSASPTDVSFSPNNKLLAVAVGQNIEIYDIKNYAKILTINGQNKTIKSVEYRADSKQILSASANTCKVWDAYTGEKLKEYIGHSNDLYFAKFTNEGSRFITASEDGTVKVWIVPDIEGTIDDVSDTTFSLFTSQPVLKDVVIKFPLFTKNTNHLDTIFNSTDYPCAISNIKIEGLDAHHFTFNSDS